MKLPAWPLTTLQTFLTITVLTILVLIGFGIMIWHRQSVKEAIELANAETQKQHSEELKKANDEADKDRAAARAGLEKLISANTELAGRLAQSKTAIVTRTEQTSHELKAPKPIEQIVADSLKQLGYAPTVADNRITLAPDQFQALLAKSAELEGCKQSEAITEKQNRLLEDTITRLEKIKAADDASKKEKDIIIAEQGKTIEKFEKIAKKSFKRKVAETSKTIGLGILGALIGGAIIR